MTSQTLWSKSPIWTMAVFLLNADVKTIVAKVCKSHEAPHFHMPKCQLRILNFHTTFPFILGTWDLTIAITFNYHRTCDIRASKIIERWAWMSSGSSTRYAHYTPTWSEQLPTPFCVTKLGQRIWQVLLDCGVAEWKASKNVHVSHLHNSYYLHWQVTIAFCSHCSPKAPTFWLISYTITKSFSHMPKANEDCILVDCYGCAHLEG